jgi:hypothetical protein
MKASILSFFLLLTCSFTAYSLNDDAENKKGSPDEPAISFSETEYDFGTIRTGSEAVHYFVFSNSGKTPLVILNVRTSCGCMASEWPKIPLAEGRKDSLRVEYNTRVKGVFNKTITVQSNAKDPVIELRIKGNVVKR